MNTTQIKYRKLIAMQLKEQLGSKFLFPEDAAKKAHIPYDQAIRILSGNENYDIDSLIKFISQNDLVLSFNEKTLIKYGLF